MTRRQIEDGIDELVYERARFLGVDDARGREEFALADVLKRATQFWLKHDWQGNEQQRDNLLEYPVYRVKANEVRYNRQEDEHGETLDKRDGARVLEHLVRLVEDDRHDEYVEDVPRRNRGEDAAHLARQHEIRK